MARFRVDLTAFLAALAALIICVVTAAAQDDLISKIQARYGKTKTFRASFVQEATSKQTGLTTVTSGTVSFRKPGMMRWDYDPPNAKSLITDGFTIWMYVPSQKQVFMEKFSEYYASQLPVLFLSGQADLRQQFDVVTGLPDERGLVPLELKPKVPTPGFSKMTLLVDPAKVHVMETLFVDLYGNTTKIDFKNIETDIDIPEGSFIFTPPEGVEVITSPY